VYDYIIVGGGSAGSVLANRLSARKPNEVLVCEPARTRARQGAAGDPRSIPARPISIRASLDRAPVHPRSSATTIRRKTARRLRKYEQAPCWAAAPRSTAKWPTAAAPPTTPNGKARGAEGWNWDQCFPYFKKVERDLDFDGPWHGKDGQISRWRRIPVEHWSKHAQAVGEACKLAGYPFLPDQNGEFVEGYFPVTHSTPTSRRVFGRHRLPEPRDAQTPNLTISTDTAGEVADL